MTAAIYHRVSTVDQDPNAAQLELHQAARARGLSVVLDVRETGSGAMNDRPGLQRVLEAAQRGRVRAVLVWSLDRFGRSGLDLLTNVQQLEAAGCAFVAVSQGLELRPGGDPVSRLVFQVLAAVAEWERETIRARTRDALRRKRDAGAKLGRPVIAPPLELVRQLRDLQRLEWSAIAAQLQCSRSTVLRVYRSGKREEDPTDGDQI